MIFRVFLSRAIAATPLAFFPTHVRRGPARGAKWTLAPFSSNWRLGGENDLEAGLSRLAIKVGAVCWDFGAHFGIHTVGMAMQVGESGQVCSFEPDPVAFRRLEYHVRINNLQNVALFQAAASNTQEAKDLIITSGQGSSYSHFRYEDEEISSVTQVLKVLTVVPDQLVSNGVIRLPDLIKVDVEGHGAKALAGSLESIASNRPIIIFSGHSPWEVEGAQTLLSPFGYEPYRLTGDRTTWDALLAGTGLLLD